MDTKYFCAIDGKEFNSQNGLIKHLKNKHGLSLPEYNTKYTDDEYKEENLVLCLWDNLWVVSIAGHIRYNHRERTFDEYKKEFPESPTHSKKYLRELSERFSGENNPNSKLKTTQQQRKENSPYCKEFYQRLYPDLDETKREKIYLNFLNSQKEGKIYNTQIEYYLKKGLDEDNAKIALKERQTTFTLEKCISKYGESKGEIVYRQRQEKWSEKWKIKYNSGEFDTFKGKSELFNTLIIDICSALEIDINETHSILTKEKQLIVSDKRYSYDFNIKGSNKLIEFNGDFWHCNPDLDRYSPDFYNHIIKMTASEIWEKDLKKKDFAESMGYEVFYIWEHDYKKNPAESLLKCLDFLKK